MSDVQKYGNRNVPKMIREWDAPRQACRAEGTPLIQSTLDAMEEHIDYAYRAIPATDGRPALLYHAMPVKPLDLPPMIGTATDARADALREAAAMVETAAMHGGEDTQVLMDVRDAILALIGEAKP